jgi:uncharacterized protein YeaO (DUF488 family)
MTACAAVQVRQKRIYDPPSPDDGFRVLINVLWPRGMSGERATLDELARELARSKELRRWYGHSPGRFDEFDRRYRPELEGQRERLAELRRLVRSGPLTILFATRDAALSHVTVLTDVLRRGLRQRS